MALILTNFSVEEGYHDARGRRRSADPCILIFIFLVWRKSGRKMGLATAAVRR